MTENEAKEQLESFSQYDLGLDEAIAVDMAIEALEKQIPQKVRNIHKSENGEDIEIYGSDALFGYCPNCNSFNCDVWNAENCGDCGQKLDWSDEE